MIYLYIAIAFILGVLIGFGATAAGVSALINDGQLQRTPKWYQEEAKKKREKRARKNRRK